jgi:primosomal protein N' (replication factor Y)
LETIANCDQGKYQHHTLMQRPKGSELPEISLIDTRGLALTSGLSDEAIDQIRCTLERNEQALLFINRRGFAHSLQCEDCGWVADCEHCDSSMAVHRTPPHLSCHYCHTQMPAPTYCHQCHSTRLTSRGIGTEQLELLVHRLFSSSPVFRIDSDNIKNVESLMHALRAIARTQSAVLLGTQMLSKGHNFPRVTCVVVVDADSLLFSPDFRAEERLLQLLVQVAGRAGRSNLPGKVLIQTRSPDHPMMQQLVDRSYSDQARALLARREALSLPPKGAVGLIRSDSKNERDAIAFLDTLRQQLPIPDELRLIGPMPTLMTRRANMYRYQIIVHGQTRKAVHSLLQMARDIGSQQKLGRKVSWFVEIDPTETL